MKIFKILLYSLIYIKFQTLFSMPRKNILKENTKEIYKINNLKKKLKEALNINNQICDYNKILLRRIFNLTKENNQLIEILEQQNLNKNNLNKSF